MFALDLSQNGKDFKAVFVNHRLRKYETLANAVNGAVHFMKNPSYQAEVIRVYNSETGYTAAWIRKRPDSKPIIEYELDIKVTRKNTIPIESLVASSCTGIDVSKKNRPTPKAVSPKPTLPNTEQSNTNTSEVSQSSLAVSNKSTEDRIAFLKECHKKHLEKKTLENLSNTPTQTKTMDEAKENLITAISETLSPSGDNGSINNPSEKSSKENLIAGMIEKAVKENDFKSLFQIEVVLSQLGYSWYPDKDNHINVKPTHEVINRVSRK